MKAVYDQKDSLQLTAEEKTILDDCYKGFVRGGALLECPEEFAVGSPLRLDISADTLLDARVVWTQGRSVGVQFTKPFDLKKLGPATGRTSPPTAIIPPTSHVG